MLSYPSQPHLPPTQILSTLSHTSFPSSSSPPYPPSPSPPYPLYSPSLPPAPRAPQRRVSRERSVSHQWPLHVPPKPVKKTGTQTSFYSNHGDRAMSRTFSTMELNNTFQGRTLERNSSQQLIQNQNVRERYSGFQHPSRVAVPVVARPMSRSREFLNQSKVSQQSFSRNSRDSSLSRSSKGKRGINLVSKQFKKNQS